MHVDGHRTIRIFLSNVTDVTAKWGLNYVKFPKKSTIGYMTKTAWENENLEKLDDPDAFEFSVTEVCIVLLTSIVGISKGENSATQKDPRGFVCAPAPQG